MFLQRWSKIPNVTVKNNPFNLWLQSKNYDPIHFTIVTVVVIFLEP
jgi:hypothetical protein